MVFRAASSSRPTTQWLQTFCPSHPPTGGGGGRTSNGCLCSHRRGGKPRPFAIALIRMFSTPLDWPPFPSRPWAVIRVVLLMEESQKQETDSLGSGCSCDYKVSGFQKVLPESKSNCLALGWDLERGVPVAGRVALRGAVPRGVGAGVSGASAPLWVLEGLLGLRRGAHPVSVFSLPFGSFPPFLSPLACHSSPAALSSPSPGSQPTPPPHPTADCALPLASALSRPLVFSAPSQPCPCLLAPLGAPSPGFS